VNSTGDESGMRERWHVVLVDVGMSLCILANLVIFMASTNQSHRWSRSRTVGRLCRIVQDFFWRDHSFHWYTDPEGTKQKELHEANAESSAEQRGEARGGGKRSASSSAP